jgi:hypothetical protein
MKKKPLGNITTVITDVRFTPEGKYVVVMSLKQKRTFDMIKWEERTTSVKIYGEDDIRAQTEAALLINSMITKANGDLFNLKQSELLYDKTNHN